MPCQEAPENLRARRRWADVPHRSTPLAPVAGSEAASGFGPSYGDGPGYGIPVTFVGSTRAKVSPTFTHADATNHSGGYPLGADTKVESGRDSGGDLHAVVVDRAACRL